MAKPSTLALRRLNVKHKITHHGVLHYADCTEVGTIIDPHDAYTRQHCPISLERFLPAQRPSASLPGGLMADPVRPAVWEVVECYADFDKALPRAKAAKADTTYKNVTLRLRDRRTNDIILCDVL